MKTTEHYGMDYDGKYAFKLKSFYLHLCSAIFIDIYFQSLRMVWASVGYMLKSPFVDLKRITKY